MTIAVPAEETSRERYAAVLKNGRFMVACLAIGFQNTARYGLLIWVPVFFLGKDWKSADATKWISVVLPVGMALGAMTSGWISDALFKCRRSPVILICMGLAAVFTFGMYAVPRESWIIGMLCLFLAGFFVYGAQSAFWALSPDLLGRERTGIGIGVMNFFAYALAGLAEPFIGHHDREQRLSIRPHLSHRGNVLSRRRPTQPLHSTLKRRGKMTGTHIHSVHSPHAVRPTHARSGRRSGGWLPRAGVKCKESGEPSSEERSAQSHRHS